MLTSIALIISASALWDMGIEVEKNIKYDRGILWGRLKEFATPGAEFITVDQIKKAYDGKDKYGQPLALPPLSDILLADANKDGKLEIGELWYWKGYEGRRYCQTTGDRAYGCVDKCLAGVTRMDGDAAFFDKYAVKVLDNLDDEMEDVNLNVITRYNGQYSLAQRRAISAIMDKLMDDNVEGDVVMMGLKDVNSWRLLHQEMEGSDIPHELNLYDSFQGMPACDRVHDTGMCPVPGSERVDYRQFSVDIGNFKAHSKINIHQVDWAKGDIPVPEKIAVAVLDGSLYQTTMAQLKAVRPKMAKGGVIIIHDFGFEGYTGVERAVNDYLLSDVKNRKLTVSLPGSTEGVACYLGTIQF